MNSENQNIPLKVALVHDWLTGMRGGEKVLEIFCELFPEAPIYTLLYNSGSVSQKIASHDIHTAFIDRLRALAEGKNYGFRAPGGPNVKDKVLAVGSVAWYRHGGVETAMFTTLYCTAGIFGMVPVTAGPASKAYSGFGWGAGGMSIGGMEDLANIKADEYAMLTAKNLGKRAVEMARIIKAGKAAVAKG